ncbi:hypothetical protein HDG40_007328 [Paraburkholderia sp. JPY158]|uniref:Mannosyl-glycoprotein endo-beta-N-acetylglucosamidase-like domain-containing protein n=1 Tax=Paraburkholderia atlantica TaxID=2654982 RepID=A0A7W8QET4_PARAM|nr:glucosaminidase domain-containing protein [Paraburkholderia atlantica]MBB5429133.1 hypothetical protein [Paraburkholderia atlantica]
MNSRSGLTGVIAATIAFWCGNAVGNPPDVNDTNWGCYDALPTHPTASEKASFVAEIAPLAQAAERDGGPPAAGLLAMSALESGFGWTRIALFANNLFGWKFVSTSGSGGRESWTLRCQPTSDPNSAYIFFKDHRDSVVFVADRLKMNDRYAPVTRQYHVDLASGTDVKVAVARWVNGIAAAGYNPLRDYPAKVISVANDYQHPSPTESADSSLYRYSAGDAPPAATPMPPDSAAKRAAASFLATTLQPARYMLAHCDARPVTDWPNYQGRKVTRCQYSLTSAGKTLTALVYLLNPSEGNIATRIGNVCRSVGLAERPGCGRYLASLIVNQNGGQFPVAGFVIERKKDAGGQGDDPVYLEFRDGTTIQSADRLNFTDRQLTIDAMEHAARASVVETRSIARIANATRADYKRAGGIEPVGNIPPEDTRNLWPVVVRENELRAQDTGEDDLLRGLAIRFRSELAEAR